MEDLDVDDGMTVAPTLKGGLRIDIETPLDWMVLRCISYDARGGGIDLADRVSAPMAGDEAAGDWQEYVLPELRESFTAQLDAIEAAIAHAGDGEEPGRKRPRTPTAHQWGDFGVGGGSL